MNPPAIFAFFLLGFGLVLLVVSQFEPPALAPGQTWLYTNPNPFASPRVNTRVVLRVSGDWVEYSVDNLGTSSWSVEGFRRDSVRLDPP